MKRAHDVDDNKTSKSSRGDTDEGRDSKCVFFSVVVRKKWPKVGSCKWSAGGAG